MAGIDFDARAEAMTVEESLANGGFVMVFGSAVGKVKKAVGDATDILFGIAYKSSKPGFGADLPAADVPVAIIKPRNGYMIDLVLELAANRTTDIVYGSKLVVGDTTAGSVMHDTDNATGKVVGYAREAVAAGVDPADNMILVELRFE